MVNSSLIFVCPLFTPAMSCVLLCPSHAPWSSCPKSTELSRNALPLETWRPTLFLGWIFKLRRKQVFIQWASQAARRYDISSVIKFRSSGETFFSRRLGVKENFNGPRRCVSQSQVTGGGGWGGRGHGASCGNQGQGDHLTMFGRSEAPGLSGNTARADHYIHWHFLAQPWLTETRCKKFMKQKK